MLRYGAGMTEDRNPDFVVASFTPTTVTPPLSTVPLTVDTETDEKGGIFFVLPPLPLARSLRHISRVNTASRFFTMGLF